MSKGCLGRRTLSAVAAGRCPKYALPAVRRHLSSCARCRAGVVAAASGVRGLGDTVVLERASRALPTGLKLAAVAVSALVAGGAWLFAASPMPPAASSPSTVVQAQAPSPPVEVAPLSSAQPRSLASAVALPAEKAPQAPAPPPMAPAPASTSQRAEDVPCVVAHPTRSERPSSPLRPERSTPDMTSPTVAAHAPAPVHSLFDGRVIRTTLD
jgi:hypothetical protein